MRDPLEVYPYRRLAPETKVRKKRDFFLKVGAWKGQLNARKFLPVLLASFVLGRASLLGELYPYGPALVAALALQSPLLGWSAALSASLGVVALGPSTHASAALTLLAVALAAQLYQGRGKRNWAAPFLALAGVLLVKGLWLVLKGPTLYGSVSVTLEALLAGGFSLALLAVAWPEKDFQAGLEVWVGLTLMALGLLSGLQGIAFQGFSLAGVVVRLAVLVAAHTGGTGAGAMVGTLTGLAPLLNGSLDPYLMGTYPLTGVLAGAGRALRRPGTLAGLLLGEMLVSFYRPDRLAILLSLGETALAGLVFLLLPGDQLEALAGWAGRSRKNSGESTGFAKQLQELHVGLRGLASALEGMPGGWLQDDQSRITSLLERMAGRVCRGCSIFHICWEKDFYKTYRNLLSLCSEVEARGGIGPQNLPVALQQRCARNRELAVALNCLVEAERREARWQGRVKDCLSLLGAQMAELSARLARLADGSDKGTPATELFYLECAVVQQPAKGKAVCGDSHCSLKLAEGKQVLFLSDGMGVGAEAARKSAAAVELAATMLAAGFSRELMLRLLNAILELEFKEEGFATLDMASWDLKTGLVEFVKVGASPSFIKRAGGVETVRGNSLPAGILQRVEAETRAFSLQAGDMVIMVSDGILEAAGCFPDAEKWLADLLERTGRAGPKEVADLVAGQAVALAGSRALDDLTVLAGVLEAKR